MSAIDTRIAVKSLDWLDAPLRYGVSASTVCFPETISLQSDEELSRLTRELHPYLAGGLVLAPLALGNHVDHRLTSQAAIRASKPAHLAFYEDLPYAIWTSNSCLRARVAEIEQLTGTRLRPSVIRTSACRVTRKRVIAAHYRSQITPEEAAAIARYGLRYRTGERIWIPKHASNWRAFLV